MVICFIIPSKCHYSDPSLKPGEGGWRRTVPGPISGRRLPPLPNPAWLILNVASVAAAAASKSELARISARSLAGPKFIIIRAAATALRFGLVQYGRKRG